jgi:hypothetical protein
MSEKPQHDPVSQPGEPTSAPPGSTRKIRVLMERAARKEALFHPQDNLKRVLPAPPAAEAEAPSYDNELASSGEVA